MRSRKSGTGATHPWKTRGRAGLCCGLGCFEWFNSEVASFIQTPSLSAGFFNQAEKQLGEAQSQVIALRQQVADKSETLTQMNVVVEGLRAERSTCEESLRMFKDSNVRLQGASFCHTQLTTHIEIIPAPSLVFCLTIGSGQMDTSIAEINKGNTVISKLQRDKKVWKVAAPADSCDLGELECLTINPLFVSSRRRFEPKLNCRKPWSSSRKNALWSTSNALLRTVSTCGSCSQKLKN